MVGRPVNAVVGKCTTLVVYMTERKLMTGFTVPRSHVISIAINFHDFNSIYYNVEESLRSEKAPTIPFGGAKIAGREDFSWSFSFPIYSSKEYASGIVSWKVRTEIGQNLPNGRNFELD